MRERGWMCTRGEESGDRLINPGSTTLPQKAVVGCSLRSPEVPTPSTAWKRARAGSSTAISLSAAPLAVLSLPAPALGGGGRGKGQWGRRSTGGREKETEPAARQGASHRPNPGVRQARDTEDLHRLENGRERDFYLMDLSEPLNTSKLDC